MTTAAHPLEMISADEIRRAAEIVRADARFDPDSVFVHLRLHEPDKELVASFATGDRVDREVEALLCPRGRLEAIDVVVSVTKGEVRSWTVHDGMRPALLFGESLNAILGVKAHPDWQAALRKRGIENFDLVQIDPWPAGSFGIGHEDGRRISRCISYLRESQTDNGYARPIEGVIVTRYTTTCGGSFPPARRAARPVSATTSSTASRGTQDASTPKDTQSVRRPPPTTPSSATNCDHAWRAAITPSTDTLSRPRSK